MRSFHHWSPEYIKNRLVTIYYEKMFPDHPWLTRSANEILDSYLKKTDVGLEFGSGRSTVWFAQRLSQLTSVEHDQVWANTIKKRLKNKGISNVDYRFIPIEKEEDQGQEAAYVMIIDSFNPNSLDFVLVDGMYRDFCSLKVLEKIRPGGILVIDNVNWYLPSSSRSPNSRTFEEGPKGRFWDQVYKTISDWRRIWTSSGVTDTAIFFKPCV